MIHEKKKYTHELKKERMNERNKKNLLVKFTECKEHNILHSLNSMNKYRILEAKYSNAHQPCSLLKRFAPQAILIISRTFRI